eukprot:6664112-Pyramimonas_sp.AAC.2
MLERVAAKTARRCWQSRLYSGTTITPIERFQISDGGFLEIRNDGEIVKELSSTGHALPVLS